MMMMMTTTTTMTIVWTTAFENVFQTGSSWPLSYINGSVQPIVIQIRI